MAFSTKDKHIIVKYHYIDNPREDRKAFYPCPVAEFKRQVLFLKNNYKIAGVKDVFEAAKKNSAENVCALTFDDGLNDQYENALPILKEFNVTGTFFPITKTFEGFLPATHKMHVVLSLKDAIELIDHFNEFLTKELSEKKVEYLIRKTERLTTKRKMYDDIPTANLKETMNRIPPDIRDDFLKALFKKFKFDEKELSQELFMSPDEIKELKKDGHTIGSHAHSHEAFDTIDESQVKYEISESKRILEDMFGTKITVLAYPQSAPSKEFDDILKNEGLHFALGTERRGVLRSDNPYRIPRFDTNDIRDFLITDNQ